MEEAIARKKGRPKGIAREGKYGTGVKTKTVRVPENIADRLEQVFKNYEQIRVLVEAWDVKVEEAASASKSGSVPRTYEQAVRLLDELRLLIGE